MKYELLSSVEHRDMETRERLPVDVANWLDRTLLNCHSHSCVLWPTITLNITFSRHIITLYEHLLLFTTVRCQSLRWGANHKKPPVRALLSRILIKCKVCLDRHLNHFDKVRGKSWKKWTTQMLLSRDRFFCLFNEAKEEWRANREEQRRFEPLLRLEERDASPPHADVSWNNELMLSFQIEKVLS